MERWEITSEDEDYPKELLLLNHPPEVIYGIGDRSTLQAPCLSIIGARRATPYGMAIAEMAGRCSADNNIVVVSGGALGCDYMAGMAALNAGGKTIVVAGCGADVTYPSTSTDLFEAARGGRGAVISLDRWNTPPRRYAFPRRNAVIAALGKVLLVTEAGLCSGTMSTAEFANSLGKTIYAIPGSIFSPASAGTNRLISEGAQIIPDEASLSIAISLDFDCLAQEHVKHDKKLTPLLSALIASPSRPEELAWRLSENVLTVLNFLTEYEVRGMVKRLPDGRYTPSKDFYCDSECVIGEQ